ncbi:hypothetical protein CSUI_010539 [Cystoisospora suis]|uniref:Uncharacterized protein n=1 Tax=Cystoisospora suis TaxID=483139 RepID=A0A2C6KGI0_9APIC|nr:hypothetical protein CSUI_010539 [Cystoisospora suis]
MRGRAAAAVSLVRHRHMSADVANQHVCFYFFEHRRIAGCLQSGHSSKASPTLYRVTVACGAVWNLPRCRKGSEYQRSM